MFVQVRPLEILTLLQYILIITLEQSKETNRKYFFIKKSESWLNPHFRSDLQQSLILSEGQVEVFLVESEDQVYVSSLLNICMTNNSGIVGGDHVLL